MAKKPSTPGAYETGYGRPPKAHRFKPGQSGNPRGRPKGAPTLQDIVLKEASRLVGIQVAGEVQRIPRSEAVIRKLFMRAMEGDPASLRLLLPLLSAAEGTRDGIDETNPAESLDLVFDEETVRRMVARVARSIGGGA